MNNASVAEAESSAVPVRLVVKKPQSDPSAAAKKKKKTSGAARKTTEVPLSESPLVKATKGKGKGKAAPPRSKSKATVPKKKIDRAARK